MSNCLFFNSDNRYFGWDNSDGYWREEADFEIVSNKDVSQEEREEAPVSTQVQMVMTPAMPRTPLSCEAMDCVKQTLSQVEEKKLQEEVNLTDIFQKNYPTRSRTKPKRLLSEIEEPVAAERPTKRVKIEEKSEKQLEPRKIRDKKLRERKKQEIQDLELQERKGFVLLNKLELQKSFLLTQYEQDSHVQGYAIPQQVYQCVQKNHLKAYLELYRTKDLDEDFIEPDKPLTPLEQKREEAKKLRAQKKAEREFLENCVKSLYDYYIPQVQKQINKLEKVKKENFSTTTFSIAQN